jgi:hypothetical protein
MADKEREEINLKVHKHISISQLYINIANFAVKECVNFSDIGTLKLVTEQEKLCIQDKTEQFVDLLIKNNVLSK